MTVTHQIIIDPTKTILQLIGFALMMFVLHLWKKAYDRKKTNPLVVCKCGKQFKNEKQLGWHIANQIHEKEHTEL